MTETGDEKKSRSQKKREALALEELGLALVEISPARLVLLDLPKDLLQAIAELRTMKKYGAIRRQRQRIGALMREVDPEPIEKLVREVREKGEEAARFFQKIERWRDGLLAEDQNIWQEISGELPELDGQHVRALVRNALKEQQAEKPPRSSRLLFTYLREQAVAVLS